MSNHYFTSNLNYTLANEDTALELALLSEGVSHVFSVAGSGARCLPLLAKKPKLLTCVDVSREQLFLTELRVESVRALTHDEYLSFWGYPPRAASPEERREIFSRVRLSSEAADFLKQLFESREWESILYEGKWERTFIKLAAINRGLTGTQGLGLFSALSDHEHQRYLKEEFPWKRWAAVMGLVGNAGFFNALLYKGHFPVKNIPQSFYRFYEESFNKLFQQGPARLNWFLQLLFFGKVIFANGNPVECQRDVFNGIKQGLSTAEVRYVQGDLVEKAATADRPIDFISLSDVPSYFKGETEKTFLTRIGSNLSSGALAVLRNYLHVPEGMLTDGFEKTTDQHADLTRAEKVGVYLIDVYRKT